MNNGDETSLNLGCRWRPRRRLRWWWCIRWRLWRRRERREWWRWWR